MKKRQILEKAQKEAESLGMTVSDVLLRKATLYHQAAEKHDGLAAMHYKMASGYREMAEEHEKFH